MRLARLFYKNIAVIDTGKCLRCGRCAKACPLHAIDWQPRSIPRVDRRLCIGCTICMNACPADAIRLSRAWSLLPVILVLAVVTSLAGAAILLPQQASVQEYTGVSTSNWSVEESWWSTFTPSTPPQIDVSYYSMLEEEAGTEGG